MIRSFTGGISLARLASKQSSLFLIGRTKSLAIVVLLKSKKESVQKHIVWQTASKQKSKVKRRKTRQRKGKKG
jgi:hypothetical protein